VDTRMVAPAFFALLVVLFLSAYAALFLLVPIPVWIKLLFGLVLGAFIAVMVYVFVQRARELKTEDKDDLGKY